MAKEKAVVYARYSSRNQTEQSIEGQLAAAYKYAKEHDYVIIREYCDRAKSGMNDDREEFQRMISDSSKRQFTVVIVWKIDRFGRNREEIIFNRVKIKKNGVRIEYVAENVPQGPEGVIMEAVMEGMAEYYSLQLSQNVRRGLEEAAKKHHVLGGVPPLGYFKNDNKEYEIESKEAEIVKTIFEQYAAGKTMVQIASWLNEHGFRTRAGKPFRASGLAKILSNERYVGIYKWNNVIRDENAIPNIIDRSLFEKAQLMLKENKAAGNRRFEKTGYLLSGKLYCAKCGRQMLGISGYGKLGGFYSYYACFGHRKKICDMKSVRKDLLETSILNEIFKILNDDDVLDYIALLTWKYYEKTSYTEQSITSLTANLKQIKRKIENIVDNIESGLPYDLVKERLEALRDEETSLMEKIASEELKASMKLTEDHIRYFLYKLCNNDYSDPKCQKQLLDTFVNRILLHEDKVVIALNYSGEYNEITVSDIKKVNEPEVVRLQKIKQGKGDEKQTIRFVGCYKNVFLIEVLLEGA